MTIPTGTRFGHYEVTAPLGKGGMGEVCLAQDTRLQRKVALKLLPADFTFNSERLRRFELEAKTASGLNHPNIITIYDIGQAHNTHYIATEYIAGETLRARLHRQRLSLNETLDIALQIADALAAAHQAGIVHRDIKPENVMIRHDGIVKVLDFGLAKLPEVRNADFGMRNEEADTLLQAEPNNPQSAIRNPQPTDPGTVMGTPQYMSPEQARGQQVDARTDIFSFGVVLYEMLAGRPPFEGVNVVDVMAAILDREPPSLKSFLPDLPPAVAHELEHGVAKALRKDREQRWQHIKDLLLDLKECREELVVAAHQARTAQTQATATVATPEASATTNEAVALNTQSSGKIILGEIKRHRLGVALTLAVIVLAAAAFFYFNRSQPALTDKDTILLADFVNTTGDAVFDGTLKQALAVHLGQSPFLNLFADERVRETLRLMNKSPDERVTPIIGREICQRQGLKALLTGSIASLGRNYVISLEAVNGQTGDVLAREQGEVEGKEQVLRTLGEAASRLREKLGESLSSIQKFDAPIAQATTSSLEALKAYSLGVEQNVKGKFFEAISSLTAVLLRVFRCFAVGQVCNLPQACSGGNAAGYKPALRAGAT
jgi:serine/threonine protein kinase